LTDSIAAQPAINAESPLTVKANPRISMIGDPFLRKLLAEIIATAILVPVRKTEFRIKRR